jgi:hypothetical protein
MQRIDTIGGEANQTTKVTLADGSIVTLRLRYLPAVQRWMMDVEHSDLVVRGINMVVHPNILRSWRNGARFGIAVVSSDGVDPVDVRDFSTGRVSVYILSAEEVHSVELDIFESAI